MHWLKGKKTYIGAIAAGLVIALESAGVLDAEVAGYALALIVAWTGIAIRGAIKKP